MVRRLLVAYVAVLASVAGLVGGLVGPSSALGHPHPQVVDPDPVDITPHVRDGSVLAIAPVGDRVYVGGRFSTVMNAGSSVPLARDFLFAFDRASGQVSTDFVPVLDGPVETIAVAPDGTSIIVGGRFRTVQGTAQRSLAMLAPDGTRVPTVTATTDGPVNKLLVRGDRLVAGGRFGAANAVPRANLAAFSATTGALDTAFTIGVSGGLVKRDGTLTTPSVVEMDADADGTRLVVLGNFRRVAGLDRMQVAMVDLTANRLTHWSTTRFPNGLSGTSTAYRCSQRVDTQMRDVEFSADGSYFVLVTTGGADDRNAVTLCDTVSRWETTSTPRAQETWVNCTGGDTLYSVAVTATPDGAGAVYVGGHQRWLDNCGGRNTAEPGSFAANGIGAIDARTGLAIRSWNPGRTRGVGAEELVADATGLWVGSDTETLGDEFHARLGLFPLP